MKAAEFTITIIAVAAVIGVLAWCQRVEEDLTKAEELKVCEAKSSGSDSDCDSCYHLIYGADDLGCGLCAE